jgi:small GTP-binding protein
MPNLSALQELKSDTISTMRELASLAQEAGMRSLRDDLLQVRVPKLEEERFILVVLGEFNHGKTTFVNALLGRDILPTGITPTTATLNHVVYADPPYAKVLYQGGEANEIALERLGEYTSGRAQEDLNRISYIEIGFPSEFLRERVTLVDTPGVNDLNTQRAEITYGYLPRADSVIFLLDAGQILKRSEEEFLKTRILRRSRDKLIFVIAKADILTPEELREAETFARSHLERILGPVNIFPISAQKSLRGDSAWTRDLLSFLSRHLAGERARILLDNAIEDTVRTGGYLRQTLEIQRRAYQMSVEELEGRVRTVREQLEGNRRQLAEYHRRIEEVSAGIKSTIKNDLDIFVAEFLRQIPEQIEQSNPADLKRYLANFIQDRFRAWAEEEGEKVSKLCETLAEEIIQVTNQSRQEVIASLAAQFGTTPQALPIEVNTLPYDVGVFALMGLGTAVMFMNILVGGLLTIAAPILAMVMRGRLSERVREQAKEESKRAIREAADKIEPRFLSFIDEFSTRLADFVTSAGESLHQGIQEILDRTLADRRERGASASVGLSQLEGTLGRLGPFEEKLFAIKEKLWEDAAPAVPAASPEPQLAPAPSE